jgi:hypothetical protein
VKRWLWLFGALAAITIIAIVMAPQLRPRKVRGTELNDKLYRDLKPTPRHEE